MPATPLKLVCLVARDAGLGLLRWFADRPDHFQVVALFTHRLLPASENPARPPRPDFPHFEALAQAQQIPLHVIDHAKDAKSLTALEGVGPYDLLVSLSWRFLVQPHCLGKSRIADLNLHRGQLPGYEGAEPVRRMLANGLSHATISAHLMTECYDEGEVIYAHQHPAEIRTGETAQSAAERVKRELLPHYPTCAARAIDRLLERHGQAPLRLV